MKIVGMYYWN